MGTFIRTTGTAALACALVQAAAALEIEFDFSEDTAGFFGDPDRRLVLESAGAFFESVIQDDLLPITPGGGNSFSAVFTSPGTGTVVEKQDFAVPADTIIIFAGARDLGATLGLGGPGGFANGGSPDFVAASTSRGEGDGTASAVQGPSATDFAPWGGAVTFDVNNDWYVDPDPATDEAFGTMDDLFSVALHEIAHVLGFGLSDSWDNWVSGLEFSGPISAAIDDAITGVADGVVPLADPGHWAAGIDGSLDAAFQEAAMDPNIKVGTRKRFTNLDLAGLADVGWELTAIPLAPAGWFMLAGLAGLAGFGRRRA